MFDFTRRRLEGEYGYDGAVNGVPVMLGNDGGEKIIEFVLDRCEKHEFARSVESVESVIQTLQDKKFFS